VDDDAETSTPADPTLDVVNTTTQGDTIDESTTLVGAVLIGGRFLSIGAGHELSESSACSGRRSFAADDEIRTLTFADDADEIRYNAYFISLA
jgi:hypothetical protein